MLARGIVVRKSCKKGLIQQLFPPPQGTVACACQHQRCGFIPAWGIAPGIGSPHPPTTRGMKARFNASPDYGAGHQFRGITTPRTWSATKWATKNAMTGFQPGALPQAGMASGLWPSKVLKRCKTQMRYPHGTTPPHQHHILCSAFNSCSRLSCKPYKAICALKKAAPAPKCTPNDPKQGRHGAPAAVFRCQNSRNNPWDKREQLLKT